MYIRRISTLIFTFLIVFQSIGQVWKDNVTSAVNSFKSGNYNSVISTLESTIPQIQAEIGDSVNYCDAMNLLAVSYLKIGNSDKSIEYFQRTVAECNQPGAAKRKAYVTANINLAQVYLKIKDYPKAESIFPSVLSIAKSALGEKSATYIGLWNAYPS
ncbi:MAG: tetratricopeptide repeat protein, partial [Cytophagales bacterium]|nr:tetratricopeptide repeat protein [Cytophagales bacterium]